MTSAALTLGLSGLVLFATGLLIGFAVPRFSNSRMGLSAHLTAVQTGPALIAVALFWQHCSVPLSWEWPVALTLMLSSYVLFLAIGVAAVTGASSALPMAGTGYSASKGMERLVTAMVGSSALAMAAATLALCWFAIGRI